MGLSIYVIHNVYIHPTQSCDSTLSIEVGKAPGASYTFKFKDVGTVVFACQQGNHCAAGQIVKINVDFPPITPNSTPAPTPAPNFSPTPEPTPAPTASPVSSGGAFAGKHIC